jgi:hypothetical protein
LDQIQKKILKWWFGENPTSWSKSETKFVVLMVILQKSRQQNRIVSATSIKEIKTGLKRYYDKDLTERQILNVIQSSGKIVMKEKDPRNHRRTIYKINPNLVEEVTFTLVNLNNEKAHKSNRIDGILFYPLSSIEKKKFLAISHKY